MPPRPRAFPRARRVRRRAEFQTVAREGERLRAGGLRASFQMTRDAGPARLGLVTSRRLGPAVLRNRIRRVLREQFRHHAHRLPAGLVLVVIPTDPSRARTTPAASADFLLLIERLLARTAAAREIRP
jgi:ribonuclease P protein component